MRVNYGEIFQERCKNKYLHEYSNIPNDKSLWPESWKKVYYKIYNRFESVKLPIPDRQSLDQGIFVKRNSTRDFKAEPIDIKTLSNILYFSAGEVRKSDNENESRRAQSSAGARYPIEIYLLNFTDGNSIKDNAHDKEVKFLKRGVYHYNVKDHSLEYLWDFDGNDIDVRTKYINFQYSNEYAMAIVTTAIPARSTMKYGDLGYKLIYIEAGVILGYIELNSAINAIGSTIYSGINDLEVEELLDIDGKSETVVMSILLGHTKYNPTPSLSEGEGENTNLHANI